MRPCFPVPLTNPKSIAISFAIRFTPNDAITFAGISYLWIFSFFGYSFVSTFFGSSFFYSTYFGSSFFSSLTSPSTSISYNGAWV